MELKNPTKEYNFCANSSHILDKVLKEMIHFLSTNTCFYNLKIFKNIDKFHNVMLPKTNIWEGILMVLKNLFYLWIHLGKLILKKINEMATKVAHRLKVTMTK